MQQDATASTRQEHEEPTFNEVVAALSDQVGESGEVRAGVATELAAAHHWRGRLIDILGLLTESGSRLGYLSGGFKLEEVTRSLALWASSPLSLEEMRIVMQSGGWDPEPFTAVARDGLLRRLAYQSDGSLRRVRGELAGAWLSDQFPSASDAEILREVRKLIAHGNLET